MTHPDRLGGIIHTYQKYDPVNLPSPTAPPPDLVTPAFEHLLYHGSARRLTEEELARAVREEQLHELEQLWYRAGDEHSPFARRLLQLVERLGEKYQVDELAAKYEFTGRTPMNVPKALEVKEELEAIDRLLKQLEEAAKTAQIGIIDLEELAQFAEPGDLEQLADLQRQINEYLRHLAEQQGLEQGPRGSFH